MAEREYLSLSSLQEKIGGLLKDVFNCPVWVRAEISELKRAYNGHCYLTLVEKDENSDTVLARAQATVWASRFRLIEPFFENRTGKTLSVGMAVLVMVQVQYSSQYGLSLNICDIDPSFTVGEMELVRQKTIDRLRAEGMFEMNKSIELPMLPRHFAVVTSETAAGYRDFVRQLHGNEFGYRFDTTLFPAVMQGADSPQSIISALDVIADRSGEFDAVLILRGGGGAMDLVCFDDYELAVNVAQFPLPVMTGIGHDHDYHVIDMVAHTSVKTPTALADCIIDMFNDQDALIFGFAGRLRLALRSKFDAQHSLIDRYLFRMKSAVGLSYSAQQRLVEKMEYRVAAADPKAVLSRGFALALKDGRKVTSVASVAKEDILTILLADGTIEVRVI